MGRRWLLLLCAGLLLGATACSRRPATPAKVEAAIPAQPASAPAVPPPAPPLAALAPPTPQEVRQTLARLYEGNLLPESAASPAFLLGDFNGDGSPDLVVLARPAPGRLARLNSDLANWILEDPQTIFVPDPRRGVQPLPPKPRPARVRPGEALLVVVHGEGAAGWRDPQARQTYLLCDAVGPALARQAKGDLGAPRPGAPPRPRLLGDVILERLDGRPGFLFWTGGHYAWHPE
ncbi:MAG TPA: hypothetical protein VEG08_02205 [Terriglobales bacterium]|nr:hypothetical protein [Terriglobales bacterium]